MPAFATASYCFYEEDSEKPTPLALKIRSFSIPQLAQLLAADAIQPEFRKQALIEIGKRALDVSNSFELFEKGAIDATIQCLKSQDDEVLELASRALINISVDEPSRDDVYDGGGIPLLVNLLQLPNENIQANALWALINLTNNDANKESVCEVPQAIIWVVGLSGGNPHLQAYALKLLANLSESATNHGCMLDSSVTVPLLKVLVTSRNMSLMSYALFYFRNLAKTVEGREAVLAAAGLKVFVHLLKTYSSPQVRGPVLLILNTLAHHHQEATLQMLKLGALQPLMQTVQAGQDAVILLALNLLKTFAADARTHKVLVRVLADGGPSLKSLLALQQPKAPTLLAQLLQTLIPPDWSSTDDQSARAVLDTVLECLAEARVRPDVQESILLIFLPMAKLGNEYVLQDHALAAFVGKASSSSDVAVQQRALHLLALLALNPGGRLRMAKIGGLNKLLTILANPDDDPTVLTLALLALQNLLLDAQLRDIVIKTQRLRLGPFLQATEPSVAGAAQRLLQSIKVSLEASVRSKEPLPKAAAAAKPRASPTANRGGSTIIRRPAQPPTHSKQPRTAPTTAAGSGPEEDGGEVVPKREPGDDKSAKASSSEQQDEQEEEEEEEGRSSSSSTPLELFRRRSSQLSLSTIAVMKDHQEPVAGVHMHRSGTYFFSCSFDGTAKVWDTGSQRVVGSTKVHLDIVSAIQATDRHLITGSWDRTVKVWELQGTRVGRCTSILKHNGKVNCLGSAASLLATGASDRLVRLWALQRGECVQVLQGHQSEVNSLAFWRGDELLCSGGNRETLVWDLATGTSVATLPGHGGEVNAVQADESRIITGGWDKTVKLWDPRSWLCEHTVKAHTWPVRCLQYDAASNRLVTGSADKTLKVWDLRMFGECLNMLEGHTNFVSCLSLAGNVLVSGSDDCSVRLWDISA